MQLMFDPLLLSSHLPLSSHLSQQKKQKKKKKDDDEDEYTQAPRIYLTFPQDACHKYQLRAYIYQARDMHGSDESGLSGLCVCGGGGVSLCEGVCGEHTVLAVWMFSIPCNYS